MSIICFNSTKVRLKGARRKEAEWPCGRFNSTKVRLKATCKRPLDVDNMFQFYKSAIKRLMKTLIYIVRVGFNSTKVRLKENHATEYAWYYKFQFYKSAIKSNKPIAMADVSVLFQFYKSAIKSLGSII